MAALVQATMPRIRVVVAARAARAFVGCMCGVVMVVFLPGGRSAELDAASGHEGGGVRGAASWPHFVVQMAAC